MKRFLYLYATVFSLIWLGYGLYAVISNKPSASNILLFGIAFSIVIFGASWFSNWLMGHYRRVDKMAKELLNK